MPKIPQAQRQFFASTVDAGAVSAAAAPFQAVAQGVETVAQVSSQVHERALQTQASSVNSNLELEIDGAFENIKKDQSVQNNPALAKEKLGESLEQLRNTSQFQDLPAPVRTAAETKLLNLQNKYTGKANAFEIKQNFDNTTRALDETQNNFELQALTTDKSLDDIKLDYTIAIKAATDAGTFTINQGAEQLEDAFEKFAQNKARRLLNSGDVEATRAFLAQEDVQEDLGADLLQKISDQVDKEELKQLKADEITLEAQRLDDLIQNAIDFDSPLDPKNKDVKKAIDVFYEARGINDNLVKGEASAAQDLELIAAKTSTIPTAAVSTLRGQLLNGTTEQKTFAVDTITRLQEVSPQSLDAFPQRDLSEAFLAQSLIRAGVSPSKAFELTKVQVDPLQKDVQQRRNAQLNDLSKTNDYEAFAEDALDPGIFTFGPDIPDAPFARDSIIADYQRIYESFYRSTGDEEAAKNLANREFGRFYGQTEVTGSKLVMKYPPENFYAVPGLNNSWMQDQLQTDVNEQLGREVPEDNLILIADYITAREAQPNSSPTYQILVKGELGDFEELRDDEGNLLRFKFDSSKAKKKHRVDQKEELESARRRRDRRVSAEPTTEEELAAEKEAQVFQARFP